MAGNSYSRHGRRSLSDLKGDVNQEDIGKSFSLVSPVTGNDIKYKIVEYSIVEAKQLMEYELNQRSGTNLTDFSISDILPSIKQSGFNANPVYTFVEGNSKVLLSGLRRRFAVVNHGKRLIAYEFSDLTFEEKLFFAKTLDIYDTPSFCDKALKAIEYRNKVKSNGDKVNQEQLAEMFNMSHGAISEGLQLEKFNKGFFGLFPSLKTIRQTFIRTLIKRKAYIEIDDFAISELKDKLPDVKDTAGLSIGEVSKLFENAILEYLYGSNEQKSDTVMYFENGKYGKAAVVKESKSGQTVTFKASKLSTEDLGLLNQILSKYSQ